MRRFDSARRAALMQDLLRQLTGRPVDLLPFEQVRAGLRLRHVVDRGTRDVPLARIVGTLGRGREFNRAFLPRERTLRERWRAVAKMAESQDGFQPVELYLVGDAYFVVDGHHRVSVARAMNASTIEAHVTEFVTPLLVTPDASTEEIVLQSGLAGFLEATGLAADGRDEFRMTEPGGYERLLEHVNVHRYFRGVEAGQPASWPDAVRSWLETVYRPMVETIRTSGILEEFPGKTETDLYVFVMDHLHHLRERYAPRPVPFALAARHFKTFYSPGTGLFTRLQAWWARRRST